MLQWGECALLCFASICAFPDLVLAQEHTATSADNNITHLEEIVVTANKYSENAQKVPISISSLTTDALERAGIDSTTDLSLKVPGLTLQSSFNGLQPHLRGVGTTAISSGNESSVATYMDGVYIAAMSGAMLQLSDIGQVDVLRGPQGTLFGRNATGGVIMVRTKDPTQDFHLDTSLSYGNYNTTSANLYVSGGLSDNVAADFAAYGLTQGHGYGINTFTGSDVYRTRSDYALRTKWLAHLGDTTLIRIAADASNTNNSGLASFGAVPGHPVNIPGGTPYIQSGGNPWDINNFYDSRWVFRQNGISMSIEQEFGFAKLTSLTAYRTSRKETSWGVIPAPYNLESAGWVDEGHQFSQELQLGSLPSSLVTWVTGLYFLDAPIGYNPFFINGPLVAPVQQITFVENQGTRAAAVFGQATASLSDNTHATVGLRYSTERRSIEGFTDLTFFPPLESLSGVTAPTNAHKTFSAPTWRFALDHQYTDTFLGYVSYNRGFKSGVYASIPPGGPGAQPVQPEILDAYEAGVKTDLFDKRLRINASTFFYSYKDLQVPLFRSTATILENGAKARIYGIDIELEAKPTNRLSLNASAELLHDRFVEFPNGSVSQPVPASEGGGNITTSRDLAGNRLPFTPDSTFGFGADYTIPLLHGSLVASGDYYFNDGWYPGAENILKQGSYSTVNGRISWRAPGDRLEVSVWGKNLTDKAYATFFIFSPNPAGYDDRTLAPPRTYGVTLRYKM
jgi:iron complex outermembrane recepter protein